MGSPLNQPSTGADADLVQPAERRRSERAEWPTPSRLIMLATTPPTPGHPRISTVGHDLSAHGIACLSPVRVEAGARCTVSIPLANREHVVVPGLVVRCSEELASLCLVAVQFDAPLPSSTLERI